MKPWLIKESTYLIQTPYMNLRRDVCELASGLVIPDYHVVEEADYGVVFALTKSEQVIMVRQYKHGISKLMLELPAGFFDEEDEDAAAGCMREFREETGYDATSYVLVGSHVRHPTRNTNRGHLVVATGAEKITEQQLDAAEDIEVVLLDVPQVLDAVRSGEIDAVGSVASIFFALDYLRRSGHYG